MDVWSLIFKYWKISSPSQCGINAHAWEWILKIFQTSTKLLFVGNFTIPFYQSRGRIWQETWNLVPLAIAFVEWFLWPFQRQNGGFICWYYTMVESLKALRGLSTDKMLLNVGCPRRTIRNADNFWMNATIPSPNSLSLRFLTGRFFQRLHSNL